MRCECWLLFLLHLPPPPPPLLLLLFLLSLLLTLFLLPLLLLLLLIFLLLIFLLLSSSSSSSSYSIVLRCWCESADKRPPFSELVTDITTSLEAIAGYMDFSCVSVMDKREEEVVHPYDHLAK